MTARKPPSRPRASERLRLAAALVAVAISGCGMMRSHSEKHIPQYGEIAFNSPRELEMVSLPPYLVEPPDELDIAVKPASIEVPRTVTVQADGVIDLGFAGDVYVAGLSLAQVELKIARQLSPIAFEKGIREPIEVSARLLDGGKSKFYYVLGTVKTAGSFPIRGNETVLDAILQAQLKVNSLPEKAYLVRPHPHGGRDQVFKIDWFGIKERGDTLTNYQLFPGDRIVVPGGKEPGILKTLLGGG